MKKTFLSLMSTAMLFGAIAVAQSNDNMKQDNSNGQVQNDHMKND